MVVKVIAGAFYIVVLSLVGFFPAIWCVFKGFPNVIKAYRESRFPFLYATGMIGFVAFVVSGFFVLNYYLIDRIIFDLP
jgi:hypothetical protein